MLAALICIIGMAAVNGVFGNITASGIINSVSGYTYNGAAAANHVLVGNGTVYVDAATLPSASLPSTGTAGTYGWPSSVTTDAQGRVSAITGVSNTVASGWQILPGGLIIEWGTISNSSSPVTLTYPHAFPNAMFSFTEAPDNTGGNGSRNPCYLASIPTTSSVSVQSDSSTIQCRYILLGN